MNSNMTKAIKKRLIERNLTITQLANKINRSRVYTSNVIHGHFVSQKTVQRIAGALGMKLTDLLKKDQDEV